MVEAAEILVEEQNHRQLLEVVAVEHLPFEVVVEERILQVFLVEEQNRPGFHLVEEVV